MANRKPATLRDIAEATGVGISAVSRVLNNSRTGSRVSEARRQLILETAKAMRYQPNALARNLDRQQIGMFGVVLGATIDLILHPYTGVMLQGIVDGAREANYQPILFTTLWDEAERNVGVFCDRRADGLIVFSPPQGSTVIRQVGEYGVPVVGFDLGVGQYDCPYVGLDEHAAFRTAIGHLLSLGHRRITYVTGLIGTYYSTYRELVVREVMEELKVEDPRVEVLQATLEDEPSLKEYAREYMRSADLPTAMITFNDYVAMPLLEAAAEFGVSVPERLSIIGFDDIADAARTRPALTTMRQPTREMGRTAVRMLLQMIRNEEVAFGPTEAVLYGPELLVRNSTGPASER